MRTPLISALRDAAYSQQCLRLATHTGTEAATATRPGAAASLRR